MMNPKNVLLSTSACVLALAFAAQAATPTVAASSKMSAGKTAPVKTSTKVVKTGAKPVMHKKVSHKKASKAKVVPTSLKMGAKTTKK